MDIILYRPSVASDFGTPQSHAIKDESGVISKGCFVTWIHQLIRPDMVMVGGSEELCHLDSLTVTLDLISARYILFD